MMELANQYNDNKHDNYDTEAAMFNNFSEFE